MHRRRIEPLRAWIACLAWALLAGAGCAPPTTPRPAFDLHMGFARAQRCVVRVPDAAAQASVRAAILRQPALALPVEVVLAGPAGALGERDACIWLGTPSSPGSERAWAQLGIEPLAAGFRFLGEEFTGAADGVIATLADPERRGASLSIVLGNDLRQAESWVRDWTPTSRPGWQTLRGGAVQREGGFDANGAARLAGHVDVAAFAARTFEGAHRGQRSDYAWIAPAGFDEGAEEAWFGRVDDALRESARRVPAQAAPRGLLLRLFATPEELARVCRAGGAALVRSLEAADELSLVHVSGAADNAAFEAARAGVRARAGLPAAAWLQDGVAAASSREWFSRPRARWWAHLVTGELVPSVAELARADSPRSVHVLAPLRGALVLACEELHGPDFVKDAWNRSAGELALPDDTTFRAFLQRAVEADLAGARQARLDRRASAVTRLQRRGACLVPSAPREDPLSGGFGTRACEEALIELRALGASAVALSFSTALEASPPRAFGAGPAAWTQAAESDWLHAVHAARRTGLSVVLLPQLLSSEHGGWAGQVLLRTPENRRFLFDGWARFLESAGLAAELAGVDVLSLGTEAPDAAFTRAMPINQPSWPLYDELREEWRTLIAGARASFAGGLTYAARWDGEVAGIEFWNQLDFVGQNLFPSYAEAGAQDAPSESEFARRIVGSFDRLRGMGLENGVGSLVTGIGIASTREAWREPWHPLGPADEELQARFYEGLARALQQARRQELLNDGLFVWCWPSDPAAGVDARGFSPRDKPAQALFERALHVR